MKIGEDELKKIDGRERTRREEKKERKDDARVGESSVHEHHGGLGGLSQPLVGVVEHDQRAVLVAEVVDLVEDAVLPQGHGRQGAGGGDVTGHVFVPERVEMGNGEELDALLFLSECCNQAAVLTD